MNILCFTSSHKIGLTGQLTEQAIAFSKIPAASFTFLSGEKEQFPGLFNRLDQAQSPYVTIAGLDDHADYGRLVTEFKSLVEAAVPDWVTVSTNWQLAIAVSARLLSRRNFKILYIMNGYRHNYRFRSIIARFLIGTGLYLFADDVITPCSFLKNKFNFLGSKNKIVFIGEDDALFDSHPPPDFHETKRLVFPGEFRTGKNQDMLIRAVKRYIEKTGDTDIELYLPGKGERLEECKALCRKLGLQDKVHFPGFINRTEMLNLYLICQYALVSSNVETFGHCIVEPFILGRVVITRHVGVADDIIRHEETGFFFNDENDLVELLLHILPDQHLCAKVAANARKERDQFRWENICQQYFDLVYNA
ncbi:MAG: glycosyltransferase family 4 protein [Deltaproteobacteria bacterium]|nr:glycosyltransferase family 4 protein [Deltaproteobacteria bacterium]